MAERSAGLPVSGVRPEAELLLDCARARLDDGRAGSVRDLVRGGLDWERLIALAAEHGMTPLLYWCLSTFCPEDVPEAVLGRLRDFFLANADHNLALASELLRILAL